MLAKFCRLRLCDLQCWYGALRFLEGTIHLRLQIADMQYQFDDNDLSCNVKLIDFAARMGQSSALPVPMRSVS